MDPEPLNPQTPTRIYLRHTRTATYGFLAALPLLILYEVLIALVHLGEAAQIRIGAEVWMKQLLFLIGGTNRLVIALVVVVVGLFIVWYERKKAIPIRPRYFGFILLESLLYAIVFAILISTFVAFLFAGITRAVPAGPIVEGQGFWLQVALSLGAGFYEELVFRVILVSGLFWLFIRFMERKNHAYLAAAVLAALIFSAVHYIGTLGDAFTLSSFIFRFLFGLVLNALYVFRGFGVAAWTHALYDLMLVMVFFR